MQIYSISFTQSHTNLAFFSRSILLGMKMYLIMLVPFVFMLGIVNSQTPRHCDDDSSKSTAERRPCYCISEAYYASTDFDCYAWPNTCPTGQYVPPNKYTTTGNTAVYVTALREYVNYCPTSTECCGTTFNLLFRADLTLQFALAYCLVSVPFEVFL